MVETNLAIICIFCPKLDFCYDKSILLKLYYLESSTIDCSAPENLVGISPHFNNIESSVKKEQSVSFEKSNFAFQRNDSQKNTWPKSKVCKLFP